MIKGIEHIAVCSKDTAALKDWYVKMFDFKVVYDNGKGTYFVAASDGSMLKIMSAKEEIGLSNTMDSGIRHFALSIDEKDFDAMVQKIKAEKAQIVADTVQSANGVKTFFFRDIDGNIFHLIYRPNPLI